MVQLSDTFVQRLARAASASREQLRDPRKFYHDHLKKMSGRWYAEGGADKEQYLNLHESIHHAYQNQLVGGCPQFLGTSSVPQLKAGAYELELALNHLSRHEINLQDTLEQAVSSALLSPIGAVKVGICPGYKVEIEGYTHDVGQPFCDVVWFDDWIHDMTASRWDQIAFCGNRYRLPFDLYLQSGLVDPDEAKKLTLDDASTRNINERGDRRARMLSRVEQYDQELYRTIELWDFWLPLEKLVVTFAADQGSTIRGKPLHITEWNGPESGPYICLWFQMMAEQTLPMPPAAIWSDMHDLVNELWRKLARQARRQKNIGLAKGSEQKDIDAQMQANDGDVVPMSQGTEVIEVSRGGISQQNYGFAIDCLGRANSFAGNPDLFSGIQAQSPTATQDTMLSQQANIRLEKMKDRVYKFVSEIGESLGHYLFYNRVVPLPITKVVEGTPYSIETMFDPGILEGDFLQYNISIEPYSLKRKTPEQRSAEITDIWRNDIMPMAPIMGQMGMMPSIEGYLRVKSRYQGIKDLSDLVQIQPSYMEQAVGQPPGGQQMPQNTTRTYNRVNRSTATQTGQDAARAMTAMGGDSGIPDEVSSVMNQA